MKGDSQSSRIKCKGPGDRGGLACSKPARTSTWMKKNNKDEASRKHQIHQIPPVIEKQTVTPHNRYTFLRKAAKAIDCESHIYIISLLIKKTSKVS